MRFCHAFLASLLILLAITVTAEKSTRSSSIPDVGYNRGRLLRKADAAKASAIDTEDRGAWSSIKNWAKMEYWLTTGKSDDEVKKSSDELRAYVRCATKHDSEFWNDKNSIFQPPIHCEASPAEMKVNVQIRAKAKRRNGYVKGMLGMDDLPAAKRKTYWNNTYFLESLELTGRSER
ncbi:hypothetical protein PRIC2_009386 [Phytophthora ramorum]